MLNGTREVSFNIGPYEKIPILSSINVKERVGAYLYSALCYFTACYRIHFFHLFMGKYDSTYSETLIPFLPVPLNVNNIFRNVSIIS